MANWEKTVKIKHLFGEEEDWESVKKTGNQIADILEKEAPEVGKIIINGFRNIPEGDGIFSPTDYLNRYLSYLYDYANEHLIWID